MAVIGILATAASPLCADGFSESDRDLIAGNEVFSQEQATMADLPQTEITDGSNDSMSLTVQKLNDREEINVQPETHANIPLGGKDVPSEESDK